jgi:hypothetical protein
MKLEIEQRLLGVRVLWMDGERRLAARGNQLCIQRLGQSVDLATVGSWWERLLSRVRLSRHFLRLGIHHFLPLLGGAYLVVVRKRALRITAGGLVESTYRFPRGNKPASRGVCVTADGTIFLAEYALNGARTLPAEIHRSEDGGLSYRTVHRFEAGSIRHYHFVQVDPWGGSLWMGTGDADAECRLFRSLDAGVCWQEVGGGSQLWRAVGVAFTAEALFWGTDAGSDAGMHPNFVMRFDRRSGALEKVLEVQGPCHGIAALKDGTLIVSTGVEGGVNEKDRSSHLWASRDGKKWTELMSMKKDPWPNIVQFGVIRFPLGIEAGNQVIMTCHGLAGAAETTLIGRIVED